VQAPFVVEEHMPATLGSAVILFDVVQNGGYQQLVLEEGRQPLPDIRDFCLVVGELPKRIGPLGAVFMQIFGANSRQRHLTEPRRQERHASARFRNPKQMGPGRQVCYRFGIQALGNQDTAAEGYILKKTKSRAFAVL
jgi:hypothetical protein